MAEQFRTPWLSDVVDILKRDSTNRLMVGDKEFVLVVRCKDCKYFYYNKAYNIQGLPIMGNSVCDKWANGCRTDENGYCFLGERREDDSIEV